MENIESWITPLLLLPGVALLIMSTSVRYGQIHSEFHHVNEHKLSAGASKLIYAQLMRRAILFRNALVSLYSCFGLFALASLLGGLANAWMSNPKPVVMLLTCLGILGLVYAAIELVREARLSLEILKEHQVSSEKPV